MICCQDQSTSYHSSFFTSLQYDLLDVLYLPQHLFQGLGHPYRDSASVRTNVAEVVSRQGAFIQGDLHESVDRLVTDICNMIRRPSIVHQDSFTAMSSDNLGSSPKRIKEIQGVLDEDEED